MLSMTGYNRVCSNICVFTPINSNFILTGPALNHYNNLLTGWFHSLMQSLPLMNSAVYHQNLETWTLWPGNMTPASYGCNVLWSQRDAVTDIVVSIMILLLVNDNKFPMHIVYIVQRVDWRVGQHQCSAGVWICWVWANHPANSCF